MHGPHTKLSIPPLIVDHAGNELKLVALVSTTSTEGSVGTRLMTHLVDPFNGNDIVTYVHAPTATTTTTTQAHQRTNPLSSRALAQAVKSGTSRGVIAVFAATSMQLKDEFVVDSIIGHRTDPDTDALEYHVKWQNWDEPWHNTFEPAENMHCQAQVAAYWRRQRELGVDRSDELARALALSGSDGESVDEDEADDADDVADVAQDAEGDDGVMECGSERDDGGHDYADVGAFWTADVAPGQPRFVRPVYRAPAHHYTYRGVWTHLFFRRARHAAMWRKLMERWRLRHVLRDVRAIAMTVRRLSFPASEEFRPASWRDMPLRMRVQILRRAQVDYPDNTIGTPSKHHSPRTLVDFVNVNTPCEQHSPRPTVDVARKPLSQRVPRSFAPSAKVVSDLGIASSSPLSSQEVSSIALLLSATVLQTQPSAATPTGSSPPQIEWQSHYYHAIYRSTFSSSILQFWQPLYVLTGIDISRVNLYSK